MARTFTKSDVNEVLIDDGDGTTSTVTTTSPDGSVTTITTTVDTAGTTGPAVTVKLKGDPPPDPQKHPDPPGALNAASKITQIIHANGKQTVIVHEK